jgi:sugar phosphate isomerase/epimerase
MNGRRGGLWWGTVEGAPVSQLVASASRAGFRDVSITPAMYFAARAEGRTDADLRAELESQGVSVAVVDPLIRGLPGVPAPADVGPRFRSTFEYGEDDCYRVAEAVGAPAINLAHYLGAPTPITVLTDAIGAIAARSSAHGLDVLVEFMPEGSIPDLGTAAAIVGAVGAANCGLMFDTWHHWRCGGGADELRALPAGTIRTLQLSDALLDVRDTGTQPPTRDRLLPGDGAIPLVDIVRLARANRPSVAIGLEVFNRDQARLPIDERAARAKASLDRLLAAVDGASG